MVQQISIYAENKKGSMRALTGLLSAAGINIHSFVTNDSAEFGIVRMIVSDTEKALEILKENGYQTKRTSILMVAISDEPGCLNALLACIERANVNIDYLYTTFDRESHGALIIIHADDLLEVENLLQSEGFRCVSTAF